MGTHKVLYVKDQEGQWYVANERYYVTNNARLRRERYAKLSEQYGGRDNWKLKGESGEYYVGGERVSYREYLNAETAERQRIMDEARSVKRVDTTPPTDAPTFTGLPVSSEYGLKEVRDDSGRHTGYEDTVLEKSYPKDVRPDYEPVRKKVLESRESKKTELPFMGLPTSQEYGLREVSVGGEVTGYEDVVVKQTYNKDLRSVYEPVRREILEPVPKPHPHKVIKSGYEHIPTAFERAVEAQAEREKKFHKELKPFVKGIDTFSSAVTGGHGIDVEQRGLFGRLAQKGISGLGQSAITLPALPAMAAEKSFLAHWGLFAAPKTTFKETFISAPVRAAKQTYDIRTDEGKLTFIFAATGALFPAKGSLKQVKTSIPVKQLQYYELRAARKSASRISPKGKMGVAVELTSQVKVFRNVKIEVQTKMFNKVIKNKVLTKEATIVKTPLKTYTVVPKKVVPARVREGVLPRSTLKKVKKSIVKVSETKVVAETIKPELMWREKTHEIIPEKGTAKLSELEFFEEYTGKTSSEKVIDVGKSRATIKTDLETVQLAKHEAIATPRVTHTRVTKVEPVIKSYITKERLIIKRQKLDYSGYSRIARHKVPHEIRDFGKFRKSQLHEVKHESTRFTFDKGFKAEKPVYQQEFVTPKELHEMMTKPPKEIQRGRLKADTKGKVEILEKRKPVMETEKLEQMFKSKKAEQTLGSLERLRAKPRVRVREGKPKEIEVEMPLVGRKFLPKRRFVVIPKSVVKTETMTKPIYEEKVKSVVSPDSKIKIEPIIEPIVKSETKPIVEPVVKSETKPIVEPVVKSETKPIVEPIVEPMVKSEVKPEVKPIIEPVVEPAVGSVSQINPPPTNPIVRIPPPTPPPPPPKPWLNFKSTEKEQGYNVYMYEHNKKVKANIEPLPKKEAHRLGMDIADNSLSASYQVTKANIKVPSAKRSKLATGRFDASKFRDAKSNKRRNFRVEKRGYRLDSPGEKRGITAAKLISQRKKGIAKKIFSGFTKKSSKKTWRL